MRFASRKAIIVTFVCMNANGVKELFLRPIVMAVMLALAACGPSPLAQVAAKLDEVESYINDRPDSALAVLRALDSLDVPQTRKQLARAALLHSMALDKCYIDLQTDSILAPALDWYERHGSPDEKMKSLYYLGRIQYNAGDYRGAIITYTEALDLSDRSKDMKYVGFINQAIADTYAATFQENESFPYLERAYGCFLQIPDSSLARRTLYKYALSLVSQRELLQADSIIEKLLVETKKTDPLYSRIIAVQALSLALQDKTDSAVLRFNELLALSGSLPTPNHWAAYAYCLSRQGKQVLSDGCFSQLKTTFPSDRRIDYWLNRSQYDQGRYKEAYKSLSESFSYQDSLLRIQLNHSTLAAQKEFIVNQNLIEREKNRHRRNQLWSLIMAILLISISGVVVVVRMIRKNQRERARLLLVVDTVTKRQANEEQRMRKQFNDLFQEYFNTVGKICVDYESGVLVGQRTSRAVIGQIDRILSSFRGDIDGHEAFEKTLDKYLDNVMSRFREDFPHLRAQGYRLVSYIFAGLDPATICVLMDLDIDALYSRKSRIKGTISSSSVANKERYLELFN